MRYTVKKTSMQSLIVVSKNKKRGEEYTQNFCQYQKIEKFDISILERTGNTIGIEEIRNLQKTLFLKPLKKEGRKATIIKNAESLTVEAQNALLRVLEEPPPDTFIILITVNIDLLLTTILSRCKIIDLKDEAPISEKEISQYLDLLISLPTTRVGERLKLAENASKTKEEAIIFLEKLIISTRRQLIKNVLDKKESVLISQYLNLLISFNKTYAKLCTTNANPRLTLENLLLNM